MSQPGLSNNLGSILKAQAMQQAQFQKPSGVPLFVANPADMFRTTSATGLSALRAEHQGHQLRTSSVEDFLSLVASGDLPAQDPRMLTTPLQSYIAQRTAEAQRNPSQQVRTRNAPSYKGEGERIEHFVTPSFVVKCRS